MKKLNSYFKQIARETLVGAILMILLGILVLLGVTAIVFKVLGVLMLVLGVIYAVVYISDQLNNIRSSSTVVLSMLLIGVGLVAVFRNGGLVSIMHQIFAIALMIDGAAKLDSALILLRKGKDIMGLLMLLFALAVITLGVLIILTVISADIAIGIILLCSGIIDLVTLLLVTTKARNRIR